MNSESTFIGQLYQALLLDIAERYPYLFVGGGMNPVVVSDSVLIEKHATSGDLSFFTKTLPAFGRAIDKMLMSDSLDQIDCPLDVIFELCQSFARSGDASDLLYVRQLAYLAYKYESPIEPEAAKAVIGSFVEVERQLGDFRVDPKHPVIRKARTLVCSVLSDLDHRDIIPKHGPGAVSTGETTVEKTRFSRLYSQLNKVYPFSEYFCYSLSHVCDRYRSFRYLEHQKEGTAKVVLVPKDSRGPRLISCEPLEYQWIQQGLATKLVARIEEHPLTKGHVNFKDQDVNRNLALEGSVSLKWDTLDMKDASDRVSTSLVIALFQGNPFLKGLLASRTSQTLLPDGELVRLKKFAPMGSALCFPVESLCFYALAVSVLQCAAGLSRRQAIDSVYVYGDDLIVRRGFSKYLLAYFPEFGLKFNEGKCAISQHPFRESCGMDAYKGTPVTPIKVRRRWSSCLDSVGLASWIAQSNAFWAAGYEQVADVIEQYVRIQYPYIPYSDKLKGYLSFVRWFASSDLNTDLCQPRRFNRAWQRWEVKALAVKPVSVKEEPSSWEVLLRRFSIGGRDTRAGHYSLPRRAKLYRGWFEE